MADDIADDIQVEQLWIPDSPEAKDAADFLAAIEVGRKVRMQTWGSDDLAYTPQEKLLELADPYERQVILVARINGEIVGTVDIALPLIEDMDVAEFTLDILPEFQRRGVGRRLLEAAEHFAKSEGRTRILVDTNHPGATLDEFARGQLVPESGQGFVPLESREVDFARRTGYTLEHIEQFSSCLLPLDTKLIADLTAEAEEANAGRYRLHHWTDRCPDEWLEAVVLLENQAGADLDDDLQGAVEQDLVFDGGMLREAEEVAIAQGRRTVVTAVEEIATGALVGLTTITVLAHRPDIVFQDDTTVSQAHRGHKLGLLIKVANMVRLEEQFPDARIIYTWNAPENRYLLTVNRQLGFTTAGVTGIWLKELPRLGPSTS
ncbi:GNAT family N-acetyltransferase [Pseudarthrobacter sp. J75]|uniref:GNAT family N-acetyltransferase n=1 Tax=unclassified Pseudarthrobacter TaxID=2647000 RepID=UPI002E822348|nr:MULTISPECIES: GNAT family N-acetyltransferase [unclassified Pseudarthrobacter]MEE2521138.1 GNAT family N-acetyltransferase [Pseudarthrobacter sp. J47]MEE2528368.1 GNAT family N-acetyltransferase [Pseudarthrobacter sp. J75]